MNQTTPNKKTFWSERGQIAAASLVVWALLAIWSVSAFWTHLHKIDATTGAYVGAISAEVVAFIFVLQHCFHKKLRVRLWALIFGFVLGAAILVHAGALQSMNAAEIEQNETTDKIVETLSKLNKNSTVRVNPSGAATQKERLAMSNQAARAQADAIKNTQSLTVEAIKSGEAQVKESTLLPSEYLRKHMFTALFVIALTLFSIQLAIMMFAPGKTDADYDGVPDEDQQPQVQQTPRVQPMNTPQPMTAGPRSRYATVDENNVAATLPHNAKVGTRATGPNGDVWIKTTNGWRQAETANSQPTIQRPSFARRVFSGETDTPIQSTSQSTPNKPSDDWNNGNGGGSNRSH